LTDRVTLFQFPMKKIIIIILMFLAHCGTTKRYLIIDKPVKVGNIEVSMDRYFCYFRNISTEKTIRILSVSYSIDPFFYTIDINKIISPDNSRKILCHGIEYTVDENKTPLTIKIAYKIEGETEQIETTNYSGFEPTRLSDY